MGGKMFAVYLRAPGLASALRHRKAWMFVAVNHQRRAFMASVDGESEYAFHAALRPGEDAEGLGTEVDARRVFAEAAGVELPIEILSMGLGSPAMRSSRSAFDKVGCSLPATLRICSRPPAPWVTTPRSRMR